MDTKESDLKFFGRGAPPVDLEVSHARGSLVWDVNGKRYIDFHGGAGVGIFGWAKEEIELAVRNTDRPSYVYPHFYYKPWAELAELLATITPEGLSRCYRTTGGSEAVEAAMEIAMMYTGRKKFLSLEGSYHGNTLGALSLGASTNKEKFHNLLPGCEKIDLPLDTAALKTIEDKLSSHEVAGFFMEPVVCNLGVVVPEMDFMEGLAQLCRSHGTLLVMDEAITGFGRTGKLFASEHFHLKPDIMCLAKAMSAGHAGIGAVITTEQIGDAVKEKIGLYSTYGWHPSSVDASISSIRYLLENVEDIFNNMEVVGSLFEYSLSELRSKERPSFRRKGLAIGLDLKNKDRASKVKQESLKKGLIIGSEGSSLVFFPALNIEPALVEEGLKILKEIMSS